MALKSTPDRAPKASLKRSAAGALEAATLRPGPNLDVAQNYCAACHSVDYITTQPPGRGEPFWKAEVGKMIHSYGAPIGEEDAQAIVEYLSKTY